MDWIVNKIWVTWNSACVLRRMRKYNPTIEFKEWDL